MSYTNVVFNQKISRNVDRDEIEHQRINDRGRRVVIQLASNRGSRQLAISSSNLQSSPLWQLTVSPNLLRAGTFQQEPRR
jgi:G:T-mismatch repair DNA endonuclease (very short patch repair protein)